MLIRLCNCRTKLILMVSRLKVTLDSGSGPEIYQTAAIVDGKLVYELSQAVYWKGWLGKRSFFFLGFGSRFEAN